MGDLESLLLGEIIKRKLINDLAQGLAAAAIAADEKDNDNKVHVLEVCLFHRYISLCS